MTSTLLKADILTKASIMKKAYPQLKKCQCIYNEAHRLKPEIVDELDETEFDCFYDESKIDIFLEEVCKRSFQN